MRPFKILLYLNLNNSQSSQINQRKLTKKMIFYLNKYHNINQKKARFKCKYRRNKESKNRLNSNQISLSINYKKNRSLISNCLCRFSKSVKISFRLKSIAIRNSKRRQMRFSPCTGKLNMPNSVNQVQKKDLRRRIKNWQDSKLKYLSMKSKTSKWLWKKRNCSGLIRRSISIRFSN